MPASAACSEAALDALLALPRPFFERPTLVVARDLLGALLVRRLDGATLAGRIVEVEAYIGPDDRASHASRGRTARTEVMFGPPGHAYVYSIYGMHCCLNVVTETPGFPAAVLIRALEPCGLLPGPTNGPARLCRTLCIDRALNGIDLTREGPLFLASPRGQPAEAVIATRRVGVDYAGEWADRPWRLLLEGNPFVSRPPDRERRVSVRSPRPRPPGRYHTAPAMALDAASIGERQ